MSAEKSADINLRLITIYIINMKKLFTLALISLVASLAFALVQGPKKVEIVNHETHEFSSANGNAELVDQREDEGILIYTGWDDETGFVASVGIATKKIAGHYTLDNSDSENTIIYESDDPEAEPVLALSLTMDVEETETGYKATCIYVGDNATEYTLIFDIEMEKEEGGDEEEVITATLPYSTNFEKDEDNPDIPYGLKVIDNNDDGKTWSFVNNPKKGGIPSAKYTYSSSKAADDYVVFPGMELKAGEVYKIDFSACCEDASCPERMEIVAGLQAEASALTIPVMAPTVINRTTINTFTTEFAPEADGLYYLAMHAISDKDQYYLWIDQFSVEKVDLKSPNPATNLSVSGDASGSLRANIKFNAPTTATDDSELTGALQYEVTRGSLVVASGETTPGAEVLAVDAAVPMVGTWTYSVTIYLGSLKSESVSASAYIGEDRPSDPKNLVATDVQGQVHLTWDPVTIGAKGGNVVAANLNYCVYPVVFYNMFGTMRGVPDTDHAYTTTLTATNYTIRNVNTNAGEQQYTYFAVTAKNSVGESDGLAIAPILTGAPYELPVVETVPGTDAKPYDYWWDYAADAENTIYKAGVSTGFDNDFVLNVAKKGWVELYSGKINVKNASAPTLSFDYKGDGALTLTVYGPDKQLDPIVLTPGADYQQVSVKLDELSDQTWVRFTVRGDYESEGKTYLKNVMVKDVVANNLSVTVAAPESVAVSSSVEVVATVKNEGEQTASDYAVRIYANGEVIGEYTAEETKEISYLQTADYTATIAIGVFDKVEDITLRAEVVYADDEKKDDNTTTASIQVVAPSVAPVASIEASEVPEGVKVEWTVSASAAIDVVEDFESYEAFATVKNGENLGKWTAWDVDGGAMYGFETGNWPYANQQAAFSIYNQKAINGGNANGGYNSAQAAMFMAVHDMNNDDWMVSPELSGAAQTISFMLTELSNDYGNEKYEVWASSTGNTVDCFEKVASGVASLEWTEKTVDLPEGTKYFAIRCVSEESYVLLIDDIKFSAAAVDVTGFNIYVDQQKVATADADSRNYVLDIEEGDHSIAVTAVYGNNESAPVSTNLLVTAIDRVEAQQNNQVYTISGIRVNGKNLKHGIYVINGKKVVK